MNRFSKTLLAGVASAGLIAGVSSIPAVAGDLPYERLSGASGVETSIAVAKHTWGSDWKVVYVASNRNPVDALPAATIGDGPVVLTDGKTLNLGGVKPGKIVILGGTGAVPQGIEDQAKATGAEVIRLKGADRNATAAEIAKQWVAVNGSPKNVYVTKNVGSGSPDAVAASVLRDGPILTFTNDASAANLAGVVGELKAEKVTALGGTGVVPDAVVNGAAGGKATARLAGPNRFETAFEIAKHAKSQKNGSNVYLASGTALKDAMVAGAAKDGVILLSTPNGEGVKAKAYALGATKLIIIGGTKVMPDVAVKRAAGIKITSSKEMTYEEVLALPSAGKAEIIHQDAGGSYTAYEYCVGDLGYSLNYTEGDIATVDTVPVLYFPRVQDGTAKFKNIDPDVDFTRAYAVGSYGAEITTIFASMGEEISLPTEVNWNKSVSRLNGEGDRLSLCAPGSQMRNRAKEFPLGKTLTSPNGEVICTADKLSVICYWNKDLPGFDVHRGQLAYWVDWDANGNYWYK